MAYYLCDAGVSFRNQVNRRWPTRDKASDGWIGDTSHQATPSNHNPDPTSTPPGVVRALDVDAGLDPKDRQAMERLVGQLRRHCRDRKDNGRVSYIIYNQLIASRTYGWVWRPYDGANPHDQHCHISFTHAGDNRGGGFDLPIFTAPARTRLRKVLQTLADKREALARRIGHTRKRLQGLS